MVYPKPIGVISTIDRPSKHGVVVCPECGFTYNSSIPSEVKDHTVYHNKIALDVSRYSIYSSISIAEEAYCNAIDIFENSDDFDELMHAAGMLLLAKYSIYVIMNREGAFSLDKMPKEEVRKLMKIYNELNDNKSTGKNDEKIISKPEFYEEFIEWNADLFPESIYDSVYATWGVEDGQCDLLHKYNIEIDKKSIRGKIAAFV